MPDGAPALAFAKLMHEDTEDDGFAYKVVAPNLIKTKVTYKDESKNADLCVLPLTAATKLLGNGDRYQMLAALTHGNLYLISKNDATRYASNNLSALKGKTVGVLQLNEVPGLIFKTTLAKAGVEYQENGESADKVNLVPIAGAQDVGAIAGVDLYLLAEPAVSAQKAKGFEIVGDVQEMYGGENGYPQAVLMIKKSVVEKDWGRVYAWLGKLENAHEWLNETVATEIVAAVTAHLEDATYATSLKAPLLSSAVLGHCGIWYQYSTSAMSEVKAFITAAQAVNANMAVMPKDEFFYQK
jgi:ABC-type nitrate/sulfonate/bicarbonate transport system substrate-binding protein